MKSTSFNVVGCGVIGAAAVPSWLFGIGVMGALQLVACNSSSAPASAHGDARAELPNSSGGTSSTSGPDSGGQTAGTGGATSGKCTAPAAKVLATGGLLATDLVAFGSALYFIDAPTAAPVTSIRRVKNDGTNGSVLYTSPADGGSAVLSLWVTSDAIYFVERSASGIAALYRLPPNGGDKAKISVNGYSSGSATIGGADPSSVYVSAATSKGNQLRRVAVKDGAETVIADHAGLAFRDMQIVGSDMWFLANDGLDGYFKVALSSSTSSAAQVSGTACGFEASVTSAGAYCSGALTLTRMPLAGGAYTDVLSLPDGPVDVSMPDGNFIYLVPKSTPDQLGTLRKFPVAGGTPTDVSCDRGTMSVPVFDDQGVYWLEADPVDGATANVYSAAK